MNRFYIWLSDELKGGMGKSFLVGMFPTVLAIVFLTNTDWWFTPFRSVHLFGMAFANPLCSPRENPSALRKVWYLISFALYCASIAVILWLAFFKYKIWR